MHSPGEPLRNNMLRRHLLRNGIAITGAAQSLVRNVTCRWVSVRVTTTCLANIPFDFTMGKATLPAGQYQIQVEPGRSIVMLTGSEGLRKAALSLPEDAYWRGSQQPSLIFNRYGDQYFLSEVRTTDSWRTIPAEKVEQELQKHASVRSSKIVLAMR